MEDSQTLICNDCPRNCNMARSLYANAVPLKTGFAVKPFNLLWPEPHCIIGKNRALAAQTDRVPFFSEGATYNAFFVKMRKSVIKIQALP